MVEGQNLSQVQATLYKLGGEAQRKEYKGPVIGVKQGQENKREFTADQLHAGKNIIGLQVNVLNWI